MIPCLYASTETKFDHNGIGKMADAHSCVVTEKRNGSFELEMVYPADGIHADQLEEGNIILAKPSDTGRSQPFRIYKIATPIDGKLTVKARHISYQLNFITVSPFATTSCTGALAGLGNHAASECPFEVWTDISSSASFRLSVPSSFRNCLGGIDGSVLDTFGGEYEWDRYTVKLHHHRGADHGVHIVYGKNLIDFKMERNIESVITGVHPYWQNSETGEVTELPEKVVLVEQRSVPYQKITVLDCTSGFQDKPTDEMMRSFVQDYLKNTSLTEPQVDIDIDFIQLWNTPDYEDVVEAEQVSLCDTVHVFISKLGIEVSSKVTETQYDCLLERYEGITLSNSTVSSRNSSLTTALSSIRNTANEAYNTALRVETSMGEQIGGICNTATMFTGQKIHLYLVEGSYAEEQIRSWAGYDELLQVEEDADQKIQNLTDREDARWVSTHDGLENILTVSDRARKNNMIKMIDSSVRNSAGEVSATATALGILDRAGVVVNGIMSGEMGAAILKISEPMHLEQGKTYTVHIVDDDPPAPYSMFFYKISSSVCLQQGGSNRGVSAIGSRFEQVIPDVTGDYQMGVYSTAAVFSSHMIHAYMYEGTGWSMDDFYAYPKSDVLAATISEMAAVKDSVRKKNLVKMLSTKGFLDGTGVYRLNSIGMPDPAGIMLNGTFGTASTTMYTNISEVFHLDAGKPYTILIRDDDKTMDYNMTLVDRTTGFAVKENGVNLAFNVQRSPFDTFTPDASMDVRLRINYRKQMTLTDHILHVYVCEGKFKLSELLSFAQEKEEDTSFPYASYNLPLLMSVIFRVWACSFILRRKDWIRQRRCQS